MSINWKDPRKKLPPSGVEMEVLVKGHSDWVNGKYYVSWWDGKGNFGGTGTWVSEGIFTIESWAYIDGEH